MNASQIVATIKVKSLTPSLAAKEAVCLCYTWNSTVMYYLQGRKHAEIGGAWRTHSEWFKVPTGSILGLLLFHELV